MIHRTVIMGLAALLVVLATCAVAFVLVARAYDGAVERQEGQALKATIEAHERTMIQAVGTVVEEAQVLSELARGDLDGMHQAFGRKLTRGFDLEYVYIADSDGNLVYTSEHGEAGVRAAAKALQPALRRLIGGLTHLEPGATNFGVAVGAGEGVLLIARVFQQADVSVPGHTPLIAVAADVLDPTLLHELAAPARLTEVVVTPAAAGDAAADGLTLPNLYDGGKVRLRWHGSQPGAGLLWAAMPVALAAAVVLCATFFVLLLRSRRLAAELQQSEARARELANQDQLTGLASRRHFLTLLEAALRPPMGRRQLALVFVDLDGFKAVNDTNGHAAGDELLRVMGHRLRDSVGGRGVVARVGGDEFVLYVQYDTDEEFAALQVTLDTALNRPVELEGQDLRVGASMGAARAPRDASGAAELMRLADIALYRAKGDGGGIFRMFEPALEQAHLHRRRIEQELMRALDRHELTVLYQPQVDVETERVVGFEALVRWDHPTRGRILPGEFVPIAEHSRLITRLDAAVLLRACREATALPGVTLSVNLSPINLRSPGFADTVEATLLETGFDPHRLEFELTESAIIDAGEETRQALQQLRERGVRFALDDFGTGHASLVHIRRFPISKIKIDRWFIRNLGLQRDVASIVEYVVRLARALGVTVTAEGVETREQLRFLRAFGAHQGQGFLFAPPLPLAEAVAMLERQRAGDRVVPVRSGPEDQVPDGLNPVN